jgi:hypothetical protein
MSLSTFGNYDFANYYTFKIITFLAFLSFLKLNEYLHRENKTFKEVDNQIMGIYFE